MHSFTRIAASTIVAIVTSSCSSPTGADLTPLSSAQTPEAGSSPSASTTTCVFDDATAKFDEGCTFAP